MMNGRQFMKSQGYLLRLADVSVAGVSTVYGLLAPSLPWFIGGLLGFAVVWIDPVQRIRKHFFVRLQRKHV
jgi:hypothetical protein